ncbi:MAG: PAS domain S-box protein [Proteobacteria bacterium]|nr:PAS domain S-box protein [Pseudomonadota bacterium]MDA1356420.1 PAS domain S-box protein [Pseudomonadota bacterium]
MSSLKRPDDGRAIAPQKRMKDDVCLLQHKPATSAAPSAENAPFEIGDSHFRAAFESAGVGIVLADFDGRILQANRALCMMLGYEPGELNGKNFAELTRSEDVASGQEYRLPAIAREEPYHRLEKRYLTKDGGAISAEVTSTPNFGLDGEFLYMTVVIEDITARREAEAALQRSEARLAEAQLVTNTGSWERDLATDEEFWSAQQYRIFGYDNRALEVTNRRFLEFVHPEDVARVQAENDRLAAAGGNYDLIFRIIRKDGVERIVRSRGAMLKNAEGRHGRTVGTLTDITDFHVAEQALADSEGRFGAIFEEAPSGIIISGRDGVFQQCNPAIGRLLGYSVDELVGKHFSEITHPDDRADNIHLADRLIIGEISNFDMEKRFLRKDGSVLWAHLSVSITRDISGRPHSRIAIVEDISARKAALAALEESQARLLESQHVANVGNWVIYYSGTEQALVHWSASQCQIYGLVEGAHPINFEEYLGFVHPESRCRECRLGGGFTIRRDLRNGSPHCPVRRHNSSHFDACPVYR